MKRFILTAVVAFSTFTLLAQSQTAITTFNKTPQPSLIYNLPYSDEAVNNAIENKMSTYGKPKKVKGSLMYKDILVTEISKEPITLYFSAEKKSNKDDGNTVLTMLISNKFDQFYSATENPDLYAKAKAYLNSFQPAVVSANLELEIKNQDETVNKTDKKLKNLRDNSIDYEKQKKKLEEKITQNNLDISAQEQELLKLKQQLDTMMKQRKN